MIDTSVNTQRLAYKRLQLPANPLRQPTSSAPKDSVQTKAVRFGSLEPARLTLVRRYTLPLASVATLAVCMLLGRQSLSLQFWALALVALLTSAGIFSPLDFRFQSSLAQRTRRAAWRITLQWTGVAAVLTFISIAFKLPPIFARDIMPVWFLATPVALLLLDSLSVPIAKRLIAERSIAERFIIIGVNEVGLELARRIAQCRTGGHFLGFFDYRSAGRLGETLEHSVTVHCSTHSLADFVRDNAVTRVYLALPISTTPRIEELTQALRDTTASVYFVPNIFAFDLVQARCVDVNGMLVLSICDSPLHGMSGIWKRAFDALLASVALLLCWPVLLTVALAIKLSSPGPALFKQRRYGLNGEEILVYKFRTMTVCEDGTAVQQAVKRDRRITPLGKFLRRTSLDELPQILNILEGKMSFVGPRPHAVAHNETYRRLISGYMIRHKVRPGITGWAQVNGLRGETSTVELMQRRVQHDIDYLKNWSLALDLKIIARTAWTVWRDPNAY